jgi:hypothetical protein
MKGMTFTHKKIMGSWEVIAITSQLLELLTQITTRPIIGNLLFYCGLRLD